VDVVVTGARLGTSLDGFHGLVLTGGTDVDPVLYGEPRQPETDAPDVGRDAAECVLLAQAIERDLPVLAICRGMQLLNVYHGGTLIQHIPPERRHWTRGVDHVHEADVAPASLLGRSVGVARLGVNSRHHQAVKHLGEALIVTGRAPEDETIEAIERPSSGFVLGVQWHPEDLAATIPAQRAIFAAFTAACAKAIRLE
jgi:putative glutamine amidotransferase